MWTPDSVVLSVASSISAQLHLRVVLQFGMDIIVVFIRKYKKSDECFTWEEGVIGGEA